MNTQPKKQLRITGCRDALMWYANLVGQTVPYLGTWPEGYRSREPAGYINVVRFEDAEVIDVEDSDATNPSPDTPPEHHARNDAGKLNLVSERSWLAKCRHEKVEMENRALRAELAHWKRKHAINELIAERDSFAEELLASYWHVFSQGQTKAEKSVMAERGRQVSVEGWTPEHDDEHVNDEIAALACFYTMPPGARDWSGPDGYGETLGAAMLPDGWKATTGDRRRELVKAGALILAEIERLDRSEVNAKAAKGEG
jgi:hypothetical protein